MNDEDIAADALRKLARAARTTKWITPEAVSDHRETLEAVLDSRASDIYPEYFEYEPIDISEVIRLCDEVSSAAANLRDSDIARAIEDHANATIKKVSAIASRDDRHLSQWSLGATGLPKDTTFNLAQQILCNRTDLDSEPKAFSSTDLLHAISHALDSYGLDTWSIELNAHMAARMSVLGLRKRLRVRTDLQLTRRQLQRLIVHEIGGHVLRWENAWHQTSPLLSTPLGNTVPTEEGLAVLLENQLEVIDIAQMRTYAARVLAVNFAQEHGIVQVARILQPFIGKSEAAEIAIRVKRGLVNPNRPGGITKDHGYLSGYLDLRTLDLESISLLRSVKWPLSALDDLRRLARNGRISKPLHEPDLDLLGLRSAGSSTLGDAVTR